MALLLCLDSKHLNNFLLTLSKDFKVYAPLRFKNSVVFQAINSKRDVKRLDLNTLPELPVKSLFFPSVEKLFSFNREMVEEFPTVDKKIIFGLRKCDLNAIKRQDLLFSHHNDVWYQHRRELTILIGIHCFEPLTKYCFCNSQELEEFYDLMFYPLKDLFVVEIGSDLGLSIVKSYNRFFRDVSSNTLKEKLKIDFGVLKASTPKTRVLNINHKHIKNTIHIKNIPDRDWDLISEKCLSCGICTASCPCCYCFEIYDDNDAKARLRSWSSCQLLGFTKTAAGITREARRDRFRHRIMHQIVYFKERYGKQLCTGCGRCIANCPALIDWVEFVNSRITQESMTR